MGGENKEDNLVLLTYREHIIAHLLLVRIYPESKDLIRAVSFMLSVDRVNENGKTISIPIKNSKLAEEIKLKSLELNRGVNSPSFGRKISEKHKESISKANKGRKVSDITRERMSNAQKGKTASLETREKLSKSHKGLKVHSEQRKRQLSENWKLNNPRKNMDMTGKNNPSSKEVIGPDGKRYESIKIAARVNGISYEKMRKWVKNCPEKGFYILIK